MEPLELPPHADFSHHKTPKPSENDKPDDTVTEIEEQAVIKPKSVSKWFNRDSIENLTTKECIIRGACVMLLPMTAAIDWNYGTYIMIAIVPLIFYLEFTAFTMYCPIKRLFSDYSHPSKVE